MRRGGQALTISNLAFLLFSSDGAANKAVKGLKENRTEEASRALRKGIKIHTQRFSHDFSSILLKVEDENRENMTWQPSESVT